MDASRSPWLLLPRRVRELPADLATVAVLVTLTNVVVFAPVIRDTPLRVPVGLAFVLFVPGYAFIAARSRSRGAARPAMRQRSRTVTRLEAVARLETVTRLEAVTGYSGPCSPVGRAPAASNAWRSPSG